MAVRVVTALIILCSVPLLNPPTGGTAMASFQAGNSLLLSEAEEKDFARLVTLTLGWTRTWTSYDNLCLTDGGGRRVSFNDLFDGQAGKQVQMGMLISEGEVRTFFDSLHIAFVFPRLGRSGLAPAQVRFFCEPSYEDYLRNESVRRAGREAVLAEALKQAGRPDAADAIKKRVVAENVRYESRTILLAAPQALADGPSDGLEQIYQAVLRAFEERVVEAHCQFSKMDSKLRLAIPKFQVGDPMVYLLWSSPPEIGETVELVWFVRDKTGRYTAEGGKTAGLPDQVEFWRARIRKNLLREVEISCKEK